MRLAAKGRIMKKEELRNALMNELWRMYKMDIIVHLMEFVEGETAALGYLVRHEGMRVNPSQISEELNISRARTANILRSLRQKGLIGMEIADDDRRKMYVELTGAGRAHFSKKFAFIQNYFDIYIDAIGEQDITELIRLLKKTVDSEELLCSKQMLPEEKDDR